MSLLSLIVLIINNSILFIQSNPFIVNHILQNYVLTLSNFANKRLIFALIYYFNATRQHDNNRKLTIRELTLSGIDCIKIRIFQF